MSKLILATLLSASSAAVITAQTTVEQPKNELFAGGGPGSSRVDYDRGERYLHELAYLTGGRVYEASRDLRYLRDAFSQIAEELGQQYSIGYYPRRKGESGERRQIKVRVSRPNVAVRARDKYVYKGPADLLTKPAITEETKQTQPSPVLQKKPLVGWSIPK